MLFHPAFDTLVGYDFKALRGKAGRSIEVLQDGLAQRMVGVNDHGGDLSLQFWCEDLAFIAHFHFIALGQGPGLVKYDRINLGQGLDDTRILQIEFIAGKDAKDVAPGKIGGQQQCAWTGHDHDGREGIPHELGLALPQPVAAGDHADHEDDISKILTQCIDKGIRGRGGILQAILIPEIGEVGLGHFLDDDQLNHASGLFAAGIDDFSFVDTDRKTFAGDKTIIDLSRTLGEHTICGNEFFVMDLDDIISPDLVYRNRLDGIVLEYIDRNRKESPEIPVEGNGLIGPILQPTAHEHKENDSTHAVQIS